MYNKDKQKNKAPKGYFLAGVGLMGKIGKVNIYVKNEKRGKH